MAVTDPRIRDEIIDEATSGLHGIDACLGMAVTGLSTNGAAMLGEVADVIEFAQLAARLLRLRLSELVE